MSGQWMHCSGIYKSQIQINNAYFNSKSVFLFAAGEYKLHYEKKGYI